MVASKCAKVTDCVLKELDEHDFTKKILIVLPPLMNELKEVNERL